VTNLSFNFLLSPSHDSNPSWYHYHRLPSRPCRCLIFHRFSFTSRTKHVVKHPTSRSSWIYLSKEPSYAWNGFRTGELYLFYSGDGICPNLISNCAALNDSTLSLCTGFQNWWFLMRWKGGLNELLNINFSSIVHLWTHAQILMVGSRNNCQQTKCIPKILTYGIAYLVKREENLMSVRVCRWKKCEWEESIQTKTMSTRSSKHHVYK
jgi:hypothetical protein